MDRQVESLWRRRAAAFWKESIPYIRYMLQSGVPLVTSFALIVGFAGYSVLLGRVQPDFPFGLVGAIVLTPVICWNPLRTWLREADTVFLAPREADMGRYLRCSFIYNGILGIVGAEAAAVVYSLLYTKGPQPLLWPLMLLAVLVLKLLNAAAGWRERQLAWTGARRGIRLLRWSATAVGIGAILHTGTWKAALYFAAAAILLALLYRGMQHYPVPWLTLIAEESRTQRRYAVFFSAFTDVPTETAQVAPRRYASWLAARIRYRRENAFTYLYAYTLIRTELGGILLRLTLLGMLAGTLAAYSALWSGWGSAGVCLLFVWLTGIQLGSLVQSHRHSVWRHVYPLPDSTRLAAIVKVDRMASLACGAALWLPQAIWLPGQGGAVPAFAAAAIIVLYALAVRPSRLKRRFKGESDDD